MPRKGFPAAKDFPQRRQHFAVREALHHGAEVALPGENDFFGSLQRRGLIDPFGRQAQVLNRLEHRAHISPAVVEDAQS